MINDNIFPIKTATACQFKWSWSTIFLSKGTTTSCHRCNHWEFDLDTLKDFHNLPGKIADREKMLDGLWPGNGCEYCKKIEDAGGSSERTAWINKKDLIPPEILAGDMKATKVTPRLLEVYFTNVCNQACVYCTPQFSSQIEAELRKHGKISANPSYMNHPSIGDNYPLYLQKFWEWMEEHGSELYEFQILGGEPLYQKEFEQCLNFFDKHPNPNLIMRIFSNLKHDEEKFKKKIQKVNDLIANKKIRELHIVASQDCWGPQAEYARYGMNLKNWEANIRYCLSQGVPVNIHMTISALTIPTLGDFIDKIYSLRKEYKAGLWISSNTIVNPECLDPYIFGDKIAFYLEDVLTKLTDPNDKQQKECLEGILAGMKSSKVNTKQVNDFKNYLDEIDRRRNTNWRILYPVISDIAETIILPVEAPIQCVNL
tara:strand:+ start:2555 stop:3838 length:1284 start_codon:yes stop_codon:yes gene_type:complete